MDREGVRYWQYSTIMTFGLIKELLYLEPFSLQVFAADDADHYGTEKIEENENTTFL